MANYRIPGVLGANNASAYIDNGTMCLAASPTPGPIGVDIPRDPLEDALHALQVTAANFGMASINDARVRENYVRRIKQMSDRILADVRAGIATPEEGAHFANQLRNRIMDEARVQSSVIGRARAEKMKAVGRSMEQLIEKTTQQRFPGKSFIQLEKGQRREVFQEIIESAGRSKPQVTSQIGRWRIMGRGCLLFTVAITTFNIWTAENKVKASLREGLVLGGGVAGGALAGAATGLVCGPGAPFCSTALFVVGGIMGALAGDIAGDLLDEELTEFAQWLADA